MFAKASASLFATLLLAATPVLAQGPRGGMGGPGGPNLARNKSVQEELKVTDQQATRLEETADKLREKFREEVQAAREADQSERREKMEKLAHTMQVEAHKSLAEILSPEQFKRFEQIERQQNVLAALHTPAVASALKLTDEQKTKLHEIQTSLRNERREAGKGAGGASAREKMMAERKEATDKAVALLTDEQKSTWKDLVGAPFEVKYERP